MKKYEDILVKLCRKASRKNEVPVAALLVDNNNKIVAKAYNTREKTCLMLDHAEIKCIVKANKRLKNKNLSNCTLYVTLEPCEMCKMFIKEARISKVFFMLARNPEKKPYNKTDFENWECDKQYNEIYKKILSNFFKKRR